jgi:hypothetical protein
MSNLASYSDQIDQSKQFIIGYIYSLPIASRISGMRWLPQDRNSEAPYRDLWHLEFFLGEERKIINIPEEYLADASETPGAHWILEQIVDWYFSEWKTER